MAAHRVLSLTYYWCCEMLRKECRAPRRKRGWQVLSGETIGLTLEVGWGK